MTPAVLRTAPDAGAPQRSSSSSSGESSSGDFAALFGALRQAEPPRLPEPPRNEAPRAAAPAAPEETIDEAPRTELPAAPEAPDKPQRPRAPRQPAPPGLPVVAGGVDAALTAEAASQPAPLVLADALQLTDAAAAEELPPASADAAPPAAALPATNPPAAAPAVSTDVLADQVSQAGAQALDGPTPTGALAGRQAPPAESVVEANAAAPSAAKPAEQLASASASASALTLQPSAQTQSQQAGQETAGPRGLDALAALPGSPAFGPTIPTAPATGSAQATLALPPQHPGFADELGAQLSVWTRQGVQQAELRLNPVELGPVQVRIQIEGQQAQVRFVADAAPTRDALEAALPQLAEALQREGLQLAGGSVQSQAQQQQQQQREQAAALTTGRRATAAPASPAAVAAPRPVSQRLLDLYA